MALRRNGVGELGCIYILSCFNSVCNCNDVPVPIKEKVPCQMSLNYKTGPNYEI